MTTLIPTPLDTPSVSTSSLEDVRSLDGLAAAAAQATDDARTRAVLAVVVQRLEDAAGADLGDTAGDPLVVLQRRFARVHARLAAGRGHLDGDVLHGLARALQPAPAEDRRPCARPTPAAALAGC